MKPLSKVLFIMVGIGFIAPSYAADVTCRNVWSGTASYNGYTASGNALANCATWNADQNNGLVCGCATCGSGYSILSSGAMIGPYILTNRCIKNNTTSSTTSGGTIITTRQTCTVGSNSGWKVACNCPSAPMGGTAKNCSASGATLPCFLTGSNGDVSTLCAPSSVTIPCNICGCSSSGDSITCTGSWSGTGSYQTCSTAWSAVHTILPSGSSPYVCEQTKFTGSMYRCNTGYYPIYSGSNGMFSSDEATPSTNCKRCPQYKNKAGTTAYGTSAAGSTGITGCYFNTQTCSDTAGTYTTSDSAGTNDAGSCCTA